MSAPPPPSPPKGPLPTPPPSPRRTLSSAGMLAEHFARYDLSSLLDAVEGLLSPGYVARTHTSGLRHILEEGDTIDVIFALYG
ncbi:hypothetical protein MMC21_001654, partial [Puttea exsequens]|nr:hypothetical protein [Puttea exsequens]